jgi:hypothetical protein
VLDRRVGRGDPVSRNTSVVDEHVEVGVALLSPSGGRRERRVVGDIERDDVRYERDWRIEGMCDLREARRARNV